MFSGAQELFNKVPKEWEIYIDGDANGNYQTFQHIVAGTSPGITYKDACDNFFNLDKNAGVKRFYNRDDMTFWGNKLREKPLFKHADWVQTRNGNIGYILDIDHKSRMLNIKYIHGFHETVDAEELVSFDNCKIMQTVEVEQHHPVTWGMLKSPRMKYINLINMQLEKIPKKKDEPHGANVQQLVYGKDYK